MKIEVFAEGVQRHDEARNALRAVQGGAPFHPRTIHPPLRYTSPVHAPLPGNRSTCAQPGHREEPPKKLREGVLWQRGASIALDVRRQERPIVVVRQMRPGSAKRYGRGSADSCEAFVPRKPRLAGKVDGRTFWKPELAFHRGVTRHDRGTGRRFINA
jgi:hypothetical protein